MVQEWIFFGHNPNRTFHTDQTPAWHQEPGTRGTYSVISPCIVTLGLCVWSAVHVNVRHPQHEKYKWRWILWGIFLPEYVAAVAFRQSLVANKVCKDMIEVLGTAISWTKVNAFYALMGGYAFETHPSGESFLPDSMTRVTLTPEGLNFIISHEPGLLPNLTEEDINDKSKASGFAKALACTQATWFCLSCIGRVAQGLSISLLEVSTSAHAICALIVYCLWWKNPFDVQQPTLIPVRDDRLRAVCCLHVDSSGESSRDGNGNSLPEFECVDYAPCSESFPRDIVITTPITMVPKADCREGAILDGESEQMQQQTGFNLRPDSRRFWKLTTPRSYSGDRAAVLSRMRYRCRENLPRSIQFDQSSLTRWQLASRAIREYGLLPPDARPDARDKNYLVVQSRTYPEYKELIYSKYGPFSFKERPFTIGLGLFCGIYGTVHALAWNYHFISPGEQFFWRASAVVLVAPAVYLPTLAGFEYVNEFWPHTETFKSFKSALVFCFRVVFVIIALPKSLYMVFGPLALVALAAARFYVIILSFKDVFFLDSKVFQQPMWTRYIPHIV